MRPESGNRHAKKNVESEILDCDILLLNDVTRIGLMNTIWASVSRDPVEANVYVSVQFRSIFCGIVVRLLVEIGRSSF